IKHNNDRYSRHTTNTISQKGIVTKHKTKQSHRNYTAVQRYRSQYVPLPSAKEIFLNIWAAPMRSPRPGPSSASLIRSHASKEDTTKLNMIFHYVWIAC